MVYKFRVILDAEEDIFRDIAIMEHNTLEDLHNSIVNAFGFDGLEAASFYTCDDEWTQSEEEIPLFDMGEEPGEEKTMADYPLNSIIDTENNKIIYVYDFLNMWTFFVELGAVEEPESGATYPDLLFAHGEMPANAPEKAFGDDTDDDIFSDFDDDFDEEDLDGLDFDETSWN